MSCLMDLLNREKELIEMCDNHELIVEKKIKDLEAEQRLLDDDRAKLASIRSHIKKYLKEYC